MGASIIKKNFATRARQHAEVDRSRELIRRPTSYSRHILQALAILSLSNEKQDGFRTSRIHEVYESICRQQDSDSPSLRRVRDLLKKYALLDIIEQSEYNGGSAEGNYTRH